MKLGFVIMMTCIDLLHLGVPAGNIGLYTGLVESSYQASVFICTPMVSCHTNNAVADMLVCISDRALLKVQASGLVSRSIWGIGTLVWIGKQDLAFTSDPSIVWQHPVHRSCYNHDLGRYHRCKRWSKRCAK